MPNHVHFVMVPKNEDGLRATLGEAHRGYTRYVNFREQWRGHLWQERFHSFPIGCSFKWLNRRGGKRKNFTWNAFCLAIKRLGVAYPRIMERKRQHVVFT